MGDLISTRCEGGGGGPLGCGGGGRRPRPPPLRHHHVLTAGVGRVARSRDPDRGPAPEQTPMDLDRAELGSLLQDLHQPREDVEVHGSQSYTSSRRSVSPSDRSSAPRPPPGKCTSSSIRTPPSPAR